MEYYKLSVRGVILGKEMLTCQSCGLIESQGVIDRLPVLKNSHTTKQKSKN